MLNWFFHRVYWTEHISRFHKRRKRLLGLAEGGLISAQVAGFVLLGFSTVYREGFETVLFLQALELNSGLFVVLQGVALGGAAVAAVAVADLHARAQAALQADADRDRRAAHGRARDHGGQDRADAAGRRAGCRSRRSTSDVPYWAGIWLGVFPTVETVVAQVAAAAFVVGSYLLAERLRGPARLRRSSAEPDAAGAAAVAGRRGRGAPRPDPRGPPARERRCAG